MNGSVDLMVRSVQHSRLLCLSDILVEAEAPQWQADHLFSRFSSLLVILYYYCAISK